jgi:hypothetical protein
MTKDSLIMSDAAYNVLSKEQITKIEKHCKILHASLDIIEACGGGSARCMMAEVFLAKEIIANIIYLRNLIVSGFFIL